MPRQARIDAPGALQHIIVRGIERRKIFAADADRKAFVERLSRVLTESGTTCYAWTLMPNHVHVLLQTGKVPVATVMRRLLTGNSGDTIHIYRLPDRSWRQSSLACPESTRRGCRRFPRWGMRCGIPGATTRAIRAMSPAYSSRDAK
jgi:REP element-mobilizing transposase RayT